jgi:hypothetical protein
MSAINAAVVNDAALGVCSGNSGSSSEGGVGKVGGAVMRRF